MSLSEKEIRQQIVEVGRLAYAKGWVAANDGNITVRFGDNRLISTPTGMSKGMMREDDLVICDMRGAKVEGTRDRTTEIDMHVAIYQLRPDAGAVVHAHPPVTTGFAVARKPLDRALLPEVVLHLGAIPLAGYGLPGTPALADALRPLIPHHDAILMANHGAVCYGADLDKAYYKMETLEHFAHITFVAELLGGANVLPRSAVDELIRSRYRYGLERPASCQPAAPLAAEDLDHTTQKRFEVTREEIAEMIDEALRARMG
jgi:L-fuculose-phosphate aldolase